MKDTATRFSFISCLDCFSRILEDGGLGFVISFKYVFYSGNKYKCDFGGHEHAGIPLLPLNITHTFSLYLPDRTQRSIRKHKFFGYFNVRTVASRFLQTL